MARAHRAAALALLLAGCFAAHGRSDEEPAPSSTTTPIDPPTRDAPIARPPDAAPAERPPDPPREEPPDSSPEPPPPERCEPGRQRWCDDPIYSAWGKQTCLPDRTWSRCIEPVVDRDRLLDRPATECGCRYYYFNADCCEMPDCVIPEDHVPPACTGDGLLCSTCDTHEDCSEGPCVIESAGYGFCSRRCDGGGCPEGFECRGATGLCAPISGRCE